MNKNDSLYYDILEINYNWWVFELMVIFGRVHQ